ncbi:MAG: AMP-binding protein [Stappiaceae bacterium]
MKRPDYFDELETRACDIRESDLFRRLPDLLSHAKNTAPGWARRLADVDAVAVTSRDALQTLPVMRKNSLMEEQTAEPPFGGFVAGDASQFGRVFMSPGPVWEPQGLGGDPWNAARALFAAGFRRGDIVHNTFSYHMTPGGFILDTGARALGCAVFPAGTGNTEMQLQAIATLRPSAYTGTPDYLKVLLDEARAEGLDVSTISKALVSGGALFPSLRQEYAEQDITVRQCYATADLGVIAYESEAEDGMIVNENYIVEIVRPGTGDPVAPGEVGEVVVTSFNRTYPLIRFGTGDLSAIMEGDSPCGRTNIRIKGWMGRADQRTKVKGMFVDPGQIDTVVKRHEGVGRARLTVSRSGEQDVMVLAVEAEQVNSGLDCRIAESLRDITKLKGDVELVAPGSLPNDGKIIADERVYE